MIYTGRQSQKDGKGNVLDVYLKDAWVVLVDNKSEIEAIYFGYRCPEHAIDTIKNIFIKREASMPKFFRMVLDEQNIYKLKYVRV